MNLRHRLLIVPLASFALGLFALGAASAAEPAGFVNPAVDMDAYLRASRATAEHRLDRRLTEEEFLRWSREPGTVVLDARSREKYEELHVAGAINLSFPDIAVASLARAIPDRSTRILIYCNNNFRHAEEPFPTKLPAASLNLVTHVALFTYGYTNVYELGPQVDLEKSKLAFESSARP